MQPGLLSLDVGTTLTKAVLFDLDGRELAVAEYGFKLHTPQPGWVELDPLILWETTLKSIQAIQAQVDERVEIKAIALSTQGGSLIPLGVDNEPTHNVITWLDQRAEGIVKTWQQEGVDVIPERWISSLFLGGLGAGMEWWFEQVWQTPSPKSPLCRAESYQAFNAALDGTSPGSSGLLFYPVSGTPRSGVTSGSYMGLRLDHNRAHMGRAVMESAAYELRWALQELQKCSLQVKKLWMVGGATRNPVWPRILADVTGISIWTTQYSHGPALGAAILAANGLGFIDGYPNWIVGEEFKPDTIQAPIYHASYNAYCGSMRKS